MKHYFTIIFFIVSLNGLGQNTRIDKDIEDDGKTMRVKISGEAYGQSFNSTSRYNVAGMSGLQKDSITNHLIDSLRLSSLKRANERYKVNKEIQDSDSTMKVKISADVYGINARYENTFNVKGMKQSQKDSIVNHVMDSLKINYRTQ
jgi:hypothetical protein